MTDTVTWERITSECGDFRAGFVATFRKYEGQTTDERDGRNLPVKVTVTSFARHMGIAEATFRWWVSGVVRAEQPDRKVSERARIANGQARLLPVAEKAELAAGLLKDPEVAEQVESRSTKVAAYRQKTSKAPPKLGRQEMDVISTGKELCSQGAVLRDEKMSEVQAIELGIMDFLNGLVSPTADEKKLLAQMLKHYVNVVEAG